MTAIPKPSYQTPKQKSQAAKAEYEVIKERRLKQATFCDICDQELAAQVHHRRLRGKYLCDERWMMDSCENCHAEIHAHPEWARDHGYLVPANSNDVLTKKQAEIRAAEVARHMRLEQTESRVTFIETLMQSLNDYLLQIREEKKVFG